jgi:hypothetical protein
MYLKAKILKLDSKDFFCFFIMVFLVIIRSAEGQFDIFINIKNIKIKAQKKCVWRKILKLASIGCFIFS